MNDPTVVAESTASSSSSPNPPPPPPPPHRRPRVREVSSRFMSPVASPSCSLSPVPTIKQRSISVQRQRRHLEMDADENRPKAAADSSAATTARSNLPQQRSVKKLFKENNGGRHETTHHHHQQQMPIRSLRPDTPTITATASSSSRSRLIQQRSNGTASNSNNISAATRLLLQSTDSTSSSDSHDSHLLVRSCSSAARSLPDVRSSMPDSDTVSSRLLADKNMIRPNPNSNVADSSKFSSCSRSLDLPRSSTIDNSLLQSLKSIDKPPPARPYVGTNNNSSIKLLLPPVPPYNAAAKPMTADFSRRGRKGSGQQDDVHSLRLLHNHYLQWRFANAKAEASIKAQTRETQKTLYSHSVRIAELYDSVKTKRTELGFLRRTNSLLSILESQMPYLDQWSDFEGDYLASLAEIVQALLNSSVQLPISGNIRADVVEIGEALNSAVKLMELIAFHVQMFMPKAEETEILISELARIAGGERALTEECGNLLSKTYNTQVEEWSLRGHLIQLNSKQLA